MVAAIVTHCSDLVLELKGLHKKTRLRTCN